ncbi:hypothetical protein C8J56DRAFT_781267 [Mycena floridula]|nr:hypothetical protein C8J56DRAFT_781267 [Mycena floridula]
MSVFEPETIRAILKNTFNTRTEKNKFESDWKSNVSSLCSSCVSLTEIFQVSKRAASWHKQVDNAAFSEDQLKWEAEVVEYVNHVYSRVTVHGNATGVKAIPPDLPLAVPFLGPRFIAPSYNHIRKRSRAAHVRPIYLISINIVHPLYYPELVLCPQCGDTKDTNWTGGWTGSGARHVHGLHRDERALGYQVRCPGCQVNPSVKSHCFVLTSDKYWEKWQHWKIPSTSVHS